MDDFERELRHHSRSWKAFLGAALTTGVLFLLIASTSIGIDETEPAEEEVLSYVYVPPPPVTPKDQTTPPLTSRIAESFKFDPTTATNPPDIPLDLLDVRLNPSVKPGLAIELDMQRKFEVRKPEDLNVPFAFELDEVDEVPVWLYGPISPRLPSGLRQMEADVLVLYRVTERGKTQNIYVLDSPDPGFVQPFTNIIERWSFRPARKNGEAVGVWVQQVIEHTPGSTSPFSI